MNNEKLSNNNQTYNEHEKEIVQCVGKNIYLVFPQFSCVEEIENLKENKNIEEKCQMDSIFMIPGLFWKTNWSLNTKYFYTSEKNNN